MLTRPPAPFPASAPHPPRVQCRARTSGKRDKQPGANVRFVQEIAGEVASRLSREWAQLPQALQSLAKRRCAGSGERGMWYGSPDPFLPPCRRPRCAPRKLRHEGGEPVRPDALRLREMASTSAGSAAVRVSTTRSRVARR